MSKLVDILPKPLLEDLANARCVPFVGAGLSRNVDVPAGQSVPDWDGLGRLLSEELPEYGYAGALDAVSAYCHEYGRTRLVERLRDLLLVDSAQPGKVHRAFCRIPFDLVFTTNFDFFLERAYESLQRSYVPILSEDQLTLCTPKDAIRVVKIHGDLHHPDKLVVIEEDYDASLQRYPLLATYLANSLIYNTALFIGYSLDDFDFRQIWHLLGNRLGKLRRPAYTVAVGATAQSIARFERRGVKLVNLPGSPELYADILCELFEAIDAHMSRGMVEASTSLDEQAQEELSLPRGATGRLCLFLLDRAVQAQYRSNVFPVVQELGLTPTTVDEVITPGDNLVAKSAALIDRADLIVMDVRSSAIRAELGAVSSRSVSFDKLLVVARAEQVVPADYERLTILRRTDDFASDEFLTDLREWLRGKSEQNRVSPLEEAKRLLGKQEYKAALIAAVIAMEDQLRRAVLEPPDSCVVLRPLPLSGLVDRAVTQRILSPDMRTELRAMVAMRNRVIHGQWTKGVDEKDATEAIHLTESVLQQLRANGVTRDEVVE